LSYGRYRDWLDEALDDLEAARRLFELGMWSKVCFFSYQAAEKSLKALCIKKLGKYVHTHSVTRLLGELSIVIDLPLGLFERVGRLDRHYIPTRYPNAWPELPPHKHYSGADAEEALNAASEVVELVRREVERDP